MILWYVLNWPHFQNKLKLCPLWLLQQACYGQIPKDVINRLMSIMGHLMQITTLKVFSLCQNLHFKVTCLALHTIWLSQKHCAFIFSLVCISLWCQRYVYLKVLNRVCKIEIECSYVSKNQCLATCKTCMEVDNAMM